MKNTLSIIFTLFILLLTSQSLMSKPYKPESVLVKQADGTQITIIKHGDEHFNYITTADEILLYDSLGVYYYADENANCSGIKAQDFEDRSEEVSAYVNKINQKTALKSKFDKDGYKEYGVKPNQLRASHSRPVPSSITQGEHRIIVIPLSQPNTPFKFSMEEISNQYNQEGYNRWGNYGSVRDYYIEQSRGQFVPYFDVYPVVNLSRNLGSFYNDEDIISEALRGAGITNPDIYDVDNDGYIDGLILITSGTESDNGGHGIYMGYNYSNRIGYKTIGRYIMTPELSNKNSNVLDGVGSVIHEFGHLLGLKDHYSLDETGLRTPKDWDVMDVGCYNGSNNDIEGGHVPNFSTFELQSLGWYEPEILEYDTKGQITLPTLASRFSYEIRTDNPNEWFLIENRQQIGWDEKLPGHGLLVWHIDYDENVWDNNRVNSTGSRLRVDLEEAYTTSDIYWTLDCYSYPGTYNVTRFDKFVDWNGKNYGLGLYNITENDTFVCFSTDKEIQITECPCIIETVPDTAVLTKHGAGRSSQTVVKYEDIVPFYYEWQNADDIEVNGLPDGMTYDINYSESRIYFSGTVMAEEGEYNYTISTIGNNINVEKTAVITVTHNSSNKLSLSDKETVVYTEYYNINGIIVKTENEASIIKYITDKGNIYYKKKTVRKK